MTPERRLRVSEVARRYMPTPAIANETINATLYVRIGLPVIQYTGATRTAMPRRFSENASVLRYG